MHFQMQSLDDAWCDYIDTTFGFTLLMEPIAGVDAAVVDDAFDANCTGERKKSEKKN